MGDSYDVQDCPRYIYYHVCMNTNCIYLYVMNTHATQEVEACPELGFCISFCVWRRCFLLSDGPVFIFRLCRHVISFGVNEEVHVDKDKLHMYDLSPLPLFCLFRQVFHSTIFLAGAVRCPWFSGGTRPKWL